MAILQEESRLGARLETAAERRAQLPSVTSEETTSPIEAYQPSDDEIASAAYERFQRRGGADGSDVDDWLEAERELKESRRENR